MFADDVANRRTAASVRCVKRDAALNAALAASFTGDRLYAFVGDGQITFTYDVQALMSEGSVKSAYIDLNENEKIAVGLADGTNHISGNKSFDLPSDYGVYRYRLVSESANGAISRIGYVLRMFDIADLFSSISGTLKTDFVVHFHAAVATFGKHKGRNILRKRRTAGNKRQFADSGELVDSHQSGKDGAVMDFSISPGDRHADKVDIVADLAVVRDMAAVHEHVAVADGSG